MAYSSNNSASPLFVDNKLRRARASTIRHEPPVPLLDEEARKYFDMLVDSRDPLSWDKASLLLCCEAASNYAKMRRIEAEIAPLNYTMVSVKGDLKVHPLFSVQKALSTSLTQQLRLLGLTANMLGAVESDTKRSTRDHNERRMLMASDDGETESSRNAHLLS